MPRLMALNDLDVTVEKRTELELAYLKFALRQVSGQWSVVSGQWSVVSG